MRAPIQLLLPHGRKVKWGVFINIWWHNRVYNVQYNNWCYNVGVQSIEHSNTSTFGSYVSILEENLFPETSTGPWHIYVPLTILTTSLSSLNFPKRFSRQARPRSIIRSTRCLENYMKVFNGIVQKYGKSE